jgi:hypothetical protein
MTLRELRDRLDSIVKANDDEGNSDRNDLPVYIEVYRGRHANSHYLPLRHACSGRLSVPIAEGKDQVMITLTTSESAALTCKRGESYWTTKETR